MSNVRSTHIVYHIILIQAGSLRIHRSPRYAASFPLAVIPPIPHLQSSDAASAAPAPPQGWTNNIPRANAIEQILRTVTNLSNIQVKLVEVRGTRYLFTSGQTYYLWNTVTESGGSVEDPKDEKKLYELLGSDIRKVRVNPLPEPAGLEE